MNGINPPLRPTLGGAGLIALALVLGVVILVAVGGEQADDGGVLATTPIVTTAPGDAAVATPDVLQADSAPFASIPDDDAVGISDRLQLQATGTVLTVEVDVLVEHAYLADLTVELVSPTGTVAELYSANESPPQRFDAHNAPALASLTGEPAQGEWELRVRDGSSLDTGTLERWSLAVGTQ